MFFSVFLLHAFLDLLHCFSCMTVLCGLSIFGVRFCDTGVGVACDDVAISFGLAFSCSSTGLKQEFQHSSFVPSCLFYLFSVSVSWWSPSRGPILIFFVFHLHRKGDGWLRQHG